MYASMYIFQQTELTQKTRFHIQSVRCFCSAGTMILTKVSN